MEDRALEQLGDGGQADMRVRTYIDALAGGEYDRAHMIEKDEGADLPPLCKGQDAAHFEVNQIGDPRINDNVDSGAGHLAG